MIITYHLHDKGYKLEYLQQVTATETSARNIVVLSLIFSFIGYYVLMSLRRVYSYRLRLREQVSNMDSINLNWLRLLLYGFSTLFFVLILLQIAHGSVPENKIVDYLIMALLILTLMFVIAVIIKGLNTDMSFIIPSDNQKAKITKDRSTEIGRKRFAELIALMSSEAPYLNPELNLRELAKLLDLTPRELSITINSEAGKSFFDFINAYRINFAKERLNKSNDEKLTVLEIMYDSGFNSKSSFNTAFKKHTGTTPTDYKNRNRSA